MLNLVYQRNFFKIHLLQIFFGVLSLLLSCIYEFRYVNAAELKCTPNTLTWTENQTSQESGPIITQSGAAGSCKDANGNTSVFINNEPKPLTNAAAECTPSLTSSIIGNGNGNALVSPNSLLDGNGKITTSSTQGSSNGIDSNVVMSQLGLYYVGGVVTGVSGSGLNLQMTSTTLAQNLQNVQNDNFRFLVPLSSGTEYSVAIASSPAGKICNVTNSSGTITNSDITNVNISCTSIPPILYPLTISKTGTGTGTVTSSPSGISCGGTCTYDFNSGTMVTLTATPSVGNYVFTGWSGGGCIGTGSCAVTMNAATNVTANFELLYTVNVNLSGGGTGSVVSIPPGINCGSSCVASFISGSAVQLTAIPQGMSSFSQWFGDCGGNVSPCVLIMNTDKNVIAEFNP